MTDIKMNQRELLIRNRETMQNVFIWDTGMMHLCCAYVYTMRGRVADAASLKQTRKFMTDHVGAFSNFHSTARNVLISLLDLSDDPASLLDRAMQLYTPLKQKLSTSSYLPVAAMLLAEHADPSSYEDLVIRTGNIFERMNDRHPFLISSEHYALCALMALSGQAEDDLIERTEQCYSILKDHFVLCGNDVQSMSHVMALKPGDIEARCARVLALTDAMKTLGNKWSGSYELPVLSVLSEDPRPVEALAAAIDENDKWLAKQKGFGFFSLISRMQRLLYAALLTQEPGVKGSFAAIIDEQIAMLAALRATKAANSSHHHTY